MFTFATDYFILVSVASAGVIQIAATSGRLDGLLIFKRPWAARAFGLTLVVAAFVWFFSVTDRNVDDTSGGIDANIQALFFFLGTMAGFGVTVALSSLVNLRMNRGAPSPEAGLDALRDTNYVRALALSLAYWWRNWRTQTKRYFFG